MKSSRLELVRKEEINCTDPSLSERIPWIDILKTSSAPFKTGSVLLNFYNFQIFLT
jgi:hypothetical protein